MAAPQGSPPRLVVCTAVGEGGGSARVAAAGAALGVAAARALEAVTIGLEASTGSKGVLVADLRTSAQPPRGSVLASTDARSLENACRQHTVFRAAARGRLCFAVPVGEPTRDDRGASNTDLADLLIDLLDPELGAASSSQSATRPPFAPLSTRR